MKIYIPKTSGLRRQAHYKYAYMEMPIRPYVLGIDANIESHANIDWLRFTKATRSCLITFLVSDFHVLETTELSLLEKALYGIV